METHNPDQDLSNIFPCLEEVLEKGKACKWEKPASSSCCGVVYWWHGWRERWCGNRQIIVRRMICSSCKQSVTQRPQELWPRFQVPASQMIKACQMRIDDHQWMSGYSHCRIRWWVRVARKLIVLFKNLLSGIDQILFKFPFKAPLSRFWLTHPTVP